MKPPLQYPHLALFYFPHPSFYRYDAVVVTYSELGCDPRFYGYQLKEGRSQVSVKRNDDGLNGRRYWIQGDAPTGLKTSVEWNVASESQIEAFFGESGIHWTPKRWKELSNESAKAKGSGIAESFPSSVSSVARSQPEIQVSGPVKSIKRAEPPEEQREGVKKTRTKREN